jgi:hypothetical protein
MKTPFPIALAVILVAPASIAGELNNSPRREASPIDWASAKSYRGAQALNDPRTDQNTRTTFPQQVELDKTHMPVLLVGGTEEVRGSPSFRQQGTSYVGYYKLGGATVSILGSGIVINMGSPPIYNLDSESAIKFDIAEGVTDLSFERFGATYILRMSCESATDERCLKPEFLTGLSNSLMFVGGKE